MVKYVRYICMSVTHTCVCACVHAYVHGVCVYIWQSFLRKNIRLLCECTYLSPGFLCIRLFPFSLCLFVLPVFVCMYMFVCACAWETIGQTQVWFLRHCPPFRWDKVSLSHTWSLTSRLDWWPVSSRHLRSQSLQWKGEFAVTLFLTWVLGWNSGPGVCKTSPSLMEWSPQLLSIFFYSS